MLEQSIPDPASPVRPMTPLDRLDVGFPLEAARDAGGRWVVQFPEPEAP